MAAHPLFDETVVERLRNVTDVLVAFVPETIAAVDLVLRPGPAERRAETTVAVTFPDTPPPTDWAIPVDVETAACELASAWLATGHAMPALRFAHRRNAEGRWQATAEPLDEW